jgi:hypothetical protein
MQTGGGDHADRAHLEFTNVPFLDRVDVLLPLGANPKVFPFFF